MITDSTLSQNERKFAIDYLEKTQIRFLDAIKDLNEAQLNYKADENTWSVMECAEHITLTEIGFFKMAQGALQKNEDLKKRNEIKVNEQQIIQRLTNRTWKAKSPEVVKPSGKFQSIEQIREAFATQRQKTMEYLQNTQDGLHTHFSAHPAVGTVDVYLLLIVMTAHCERHIDQILEIKSNKGFPK
ncbi:MAG: DinB family protein [Microscillaceae bacterium]|nr:DinB family protein [Microscillaceae bacterium]